MNIFASKAKIFLWPQKWHHGKTNQQQKSEKGLKMIIKNVHKRSINFHGTVVIVKFLQSPTLGTVWTLRSFNEERVDDDC